MNFRKIIFAKTFILLGMWWGWTVLVDFFIIPNVFRTISHFFEAGALGIIVFSKLNILELILGTTLLGYMIFFTRKNSQAIPMLMMAIFLWAISLLYFFYLTPKIAELTHLWQEAELKGIIAIGGYPDIQQAHQFYHRLYVGIDTAKLILLTFMMTYGILRQEKWS